ncbi:MAG: dephospho-CoA kinase [Candidatus Dormibacteraeota bacterium]|nr:dephospho-CoA kinase [Candidatus Dormibacteraeota bacterium]
MRLIGLTGGIATGKSTVAGMLARRGAAIVDADELAREVVEPGRPALQAVVSRFGDSVVQPDGRLDRTALGQLVFSDEAARRDLERITHPAINELMQQRIAEHFARDAPAVIADIPLLFEKRRQDMFEGVLLVWAPRAVQLQRMLQRDAIDESSAAARLAAQLDIDDKRALATWVIDNSGTITATQVQADSWWDEEIGL